MPSTPKGATQIRHKTPPPSSGKKLSDKQSTSSHKRASNSSRAKLTELSLNTESPDTVSSSVNSDMYGCIDDEPTLRITPERLRRLEKDKIALKDFIANNVDDVDGYLEINGWSKNKHIQSSVYDSLFTQNLNIKRLALKGRGEWSTCHCPNVQNRFGEQIDTISKENTTHLEHLYVFRPFIVTPCALMDLISRSPNLKTFRFYGHLNHLEGDHQSAFESVRFLCNLEDVYWPWCNLKKHAPTLRIIVSRNDHIETLYTGGEIACDLINADKLLNIRFLSINLNESWSFQLSEEDVEKILNDTDLSETEKDEKITMKKDKKFRRLTKAISNRIEKLNYLTQLDKLEALEVRTYLITSESDEEEDEKRHAQLIKQNETYQHKFWECVAKIPNLRYLAIYGAWDLDKVSREIAKHGLQIEYLKTNLPPNSLTVSIIESEQETEKDRKPICLNLSETIRHLVKLAKLKSVHYACHELLANFAPETKSSLKDIVDLIWAFECRVTLTRTIEELLTLVLKRGNQQGRTYRIKMMAESEDPSWAKFYIETIQKFSSTTDIKDSLEELVRNECKQRFGRHQHKQIAFWGFEQAGGRDRTSFEQLRATWNHYNNKFRPIEMYV